jgi:hypothetical protein
LKPNGQKPRKPALLETPPCRHPKKARWLDVDNGELVCRGDLGGCGEVLERQVKRTSDIDKFGRGPTNFALFHKNLGSTTKQGPDKKGAEPMHQIAVASVRGSSKYDRRPLEIITKSCPHCRTENHLHLFGDPVFCENPTCGAYIVKCKRKGCGAENIAKELSKLKKCSACRKPLNLSAKEFVRTRLAEQVIRWIPVDPVQYGRNFSAVGYMSDLRVLGSRWDPPEDDAAIKGAREVFSKRLNGKVTDEDASQIAAVYMKSVKQLLSEQRRDLKGLFEGVLDSILIVEGVKA